MRVRVKAVRMTAGPTAPNRTIWCVVAPSGRVLAERLTRQGAEAVVRRLWLRVK